MAEHSRGLVLRIPVFGFPPLRINGKASTSASVPVIDRASTVGMTGYAAGPKVHVLDQIGLADPIAAPTRLGRIVYPPGTFYPAADRYNRAVVVPPRNRAGHEKFLPTEWLAARYGVPGVNGFTGIALSVDDIEAARRALDCAPLPSLLTAVSAPVTPDRFFSNVGSSLSFTRLRFSSTPRIAERELCGSGK